MTGAPSFLSRDGRPIGPLEWDQLRTDKAYTRLAQTVITDGDEVTAILTAWFGINIVPGPLFETFAISSGRRHIIHRYDDEARALGGHQLAVNGMLLQMDQPTFEDGVDGRWDEFVRPAS